MNPSDGNMDALHALLSERARYEGWLAQLESRRGAAPEHVLERVRTDYAARLTHVIEQLRGRAEDLQATVAGLRDRLRELAIEEGARRDERAETELRAAVGELEPDHAHHAIGRCDEAIAGLMAQRESLGSELARLQEVLVLVVPPPAPAPEPVVEAPVVEASIDQAVTEETEVVPVVQEESPVESALERMAAAEESAPSPMGRADHATPPSAIEELNFVRSVVSSTGQPQRVETGSDLIQPPVLAAPRRTATPMSTGAVPGLRDPLRTVAGDGSLSPANMPSFLKDMPTEQVKTLKCQECGVMNYPTEWYCERCGGELAAM
jgi:hypothetical protein